MEFRGWLFMALIVTLLAIYLWATGCAVNGAPAPIFVKPAKLTNKQVEGAYDIAAHSCQGFTFVLLPGGVYRGHMTQFDNSACQDWSGTWKLDAERSIIYIKEWPEGTDWYGADYQASNWYINVRHDKTGRLIREGYTCNYFKHVQK